MSSFAPFQSGCGTCKPSTDYYSQPTEYIATQGSNQSGGKKSKKHIGGNDSYQEKNYGMSLDGAFEKNNYGIDYATAQGGKKVVKPVKKTVKPVKSVKKTVKKTHKGGFNNMISEETTDLTQNVFTINQQNLSPTSGGSKKSKAKKSLKGGASEYASVGVISEEMPSEIYASVLSGGKKSDKVKTSSTKTKSKTLTKTKSSKSTKSKKSMKGGMETSGATYMNQRFFDPNAHLDSLPSSSGNGTLSAYGQIEQGDIGSGMLAPYSNSASANQITGMKTGGKKTDKTSKLSKSTKSKTSTKSTKSKKSMKGGMETSGATYMNQRFFDPNAHLDSLPSSSGNGTMSAYGKIEQGDIGSGMLAPYTSSASANQITGMKTGGSKNKKKSSQKGGKGINGPIPNISDGGVSSVQKSIDGAISGFSSFMQQLDADYLKSFDYIKSIKIGNQRLIGGKKNVKSKVKKNIQKGGGNGSDFSSTLNSRGPVNAPDDYWGVDGETWFRQFNKTGDYIKNSDLAMSATPLLAGTGKNNIVSGYDEFNYGLV